MRQLLLELLHLLLRREGLEQPALWVVQLVVLGRGQRVAARGEEEDEIDEGERDRSGQDQLPEPPMAVLAR